MKIAWHELVIDAQRDTIARDLARHRRIARIREMKFCPGCVPQLFDGSLDVVPTPVFCQRHARFLLAQVSLQLSSDQEGVSHVQFTTHDRQ